ncbi:hypothetical protein ACFOPN_09280 [Xanthomonas hyacinthi]|uniref:hypothetical protein n=1 Tax=Xanthomonas hyacinthi TaxID=56455 RepID=UPI003610F8D8
MHACATTAACHGAATPRSKRAAQACAAHAAVARPMQHSAAAQPDPAHRRQRAADTLT